MVTASNKYIPQDKRNTPQWKHYESVLTELQNTLPNVDNVERGGSSRGKSRPEVIKAFLEREGESLIREEPSRSLSNALKDYGIGVDCSGFVSRAIARVMTEIGTSDALKAETLGYSKEPVLRANTSHLCSFHENSTKLTSKTGITLVNPDALLPGDILYTKTLDGFHIRIVLDVFDPHDEVYEFITAEASAAIGKEKVLRKKWIYKKGVDELSYIYLETPNMVPERIKEWNKEYSKSTYHFGRPKAFSDYYATSTVSSNTPPQDSYSDYGYSSINSEVCGFATEENMSSIYGQSEQIDSPETSILRESSNNYISQSDIVYGITIADANIRKNPSTLGDTLGTAYQGTIFPIDLNNVVQRDKKYSWYSYSKDGIVGYIANVTFVADLSPVCLGYVNPADPCAKLIAAFNADASARRVFDEVHYYPADEDKKGDPHLTIGFGHFAGGTQDELIRSMMNEPKMRRILIECFEKAFLANANFISQAQAEGYRLSYSNGTIQGVESFLESLNLEDGAVTSRNQNKFPGGGEKNGYWLNDVLVDVLKNSFICAWQVRFWLGHTLRDAITFAKELGLADHYGAVANLVSLRSSGLMNKSALKSLVGEATLTSKDKDIAAMKIWLYYNQAKDSHHTRGRQLAIFRTWFSKSWAVENIKDSPRSLSQCKYLGKAMDIDSSGLAFREMNNSYYSQLLSSL